MPTTSSTGSASTRHDNRDDAPVFVLHKLTGGTAEGAKGPAQRWLLGLEHDGRLATWKVGEGMPTRHVGPRLTQRVEDRPLSAARYEGPDPTWTPDVEAATIVDRGIHEVVVWNDDQVRVRLFGATTRGEFVLSHIDGQRFELTSAGDAEPQWRPVTGPGDHAQAIDEPPPDKIDWLYEPLWPGRRVWYVMSGGRALIRDSEGQNLSDRLVELGGLADAAGAEQLVLDGFIVIFDENRHPDTVALESRLAGSALDVPVVFVGCDVLQIDGRPLRETPLWYRRSVLDGLDLSGPHWIASPYWDDTSLGAALEAVEDLGMTGVVAKRRGAPYGPGGPTDAWRIVRG